MLEEVGVDEEACPAMSAAAAAEVGAARLPLLFDRIVAAGRKAGRRSRRLPRPMDHHGRRPWLLWFCDFVACDARGACWKQV